MRRAVLLVLVLGAGCGETHHARLDDGAGLSEGSPVLVSSVRVGQVKSIRVVEGHVDVEFAIEREHAVTLRTDACAMARRTEQGPELVVIPGEGAQLEEERAIPQCRPADGDVGAMMRSLGEGVGDLLRQLSEGMRSGGSGGPQGGGIQLPQLPLPQLPAPSPPARDPCASLRFRVDRMEPAAAVADVLPQGGHRTFVEIHNDGHVAMRVGGYDRAAFTDRGGEALTIVQMPSEQHAWLAPLTVPAGGSRVVSVIFPTSSDGAPALDVIEVRDCAPEHDPAATCTARQTGLAAR